MPHEALRQSKLALYVQGVLLAVGLLTVAVSAAAAAPRTACQLMWRAVPSPRLRSASLWDVDAVTPSDVWAVGRNSEVNSDQPILVEHWDGHQWRAQHLPYRARVVRRVAARSSRDIWIVANTEHEEPLILHYGGKSWKQMPPLIAPGEFGFLADVVALASDDVWAVGETGAPPNSLVVHWDGHRWARVKGPRLSFDAASQFGPHGFLAVGEPLRGPLSPVIARWNGTSWSVLSAHLPRAFGFRVDAVSSTSLWVTGYRWDQTESYSPAIIAHWDGRALRLLDSYPNRFLYDPVATGRGVWVVGDGGIKHWDGRRWSQVRLEGVRLVGADALSPRNIWAVGYRLGQGGHGSRGVAIYHRACR